MWVYAYTCIYIYIHNNVLFFYSCAYTGRCSFKTEIRFGKDENRLKVNEELLIPLVVANRTMQVQEEGFDFVMYNNRSENLTSPMQSHLQKVDFLKRI